MNHLKSPAGFQKKNSFLFLLLLFFLLPVKSSLVSAQTQEEIKELDTEIRKNLTTNPAQALAIIDRLLLEKKQLHDTILSNLYVYKGFYHNMMSQQDSALVYYTQSLKAAKNHDYFKAKALLNLGITKRKLGEYDEALKYLKEAQEVNHKIKNAPGQAMVLGEMASIYNQQQLYEASIPYLLESIQIFDSLQQPIHALPIRQRLANTYLGMNNYEYAAKMYEEVLTAYKKNSVFPKNYYTTLINYASCLIAMGEAEKATASLLEAVEGLKSYNDFTSIGLAQSLLGKVSQSQGNCQKATSYFKASFQNQKVNLSYNTILVGVDYIAMLNSCKQYRSALPIIRELEIFKENFDLSIELLSSYERQKHDTYKNLGMMQESIQALETSVELKDSLQQINNQNTILKLQTEYQTEVEKQKNRNLQLSNDMLASEVENERKFKALYLMLSILILLLSFFTYRYYKNKNALQKQQLVAKEKEKGLMEENYALEQEQSKQLKSKLIKKQADLVDSAMKLAHSQEKLDEVAQMIDDSSTEENVKAQIKKELKKLEITHDQHQIYDQMFEELHPDFKNKLAQLYPQLNKKDIFFCSLLKIKMPHKEIATLINIAPESVVKKKYRLKKKMGIINENEFETLLQQL